MNFLIGLNTTRFSVVSSGALMTIKECGIFRYLTFRLIGLFSDESNDANCGVCLTPTLTIGPIVPNSPIVWTSASRTCPHGKVI